MSRKKEMDMLNGSISDKILLFALPLASSSILQQLFNSADIAVVGNYAGSNSLAAVGSTGPVIGLTINLFVGLSIGANVVAAKYLGQNNKEGVQKTVHTSLLLAFLGGLILLSLGQLIIEPILTFMLTPPEVMPLATLYMRIYFLGMPFILLYNFGSALLRSIGDTTRPLICLTVSGIINVILNLIFVIGFKRGVDGVAIATVASNVVSSSMVLYFLTKEKSAIHLDLKALKIHKGIVKEVCKIGIPAGVQGIVFSLSNVCIQGTLNTFGPVAMAGSSAAINFEYYTYYVLNAFGQTCTTFVSQNMGAGNLKRCKQVVVRALTMSTIAVGIVVGIFLVFDVEFLSIFTKKPEDIVYGLQRMHVILIFQLLNSALEVLSGAMRGMGHSATPAIIAIVGVCGLRLLYIATVFQVFRSFRGLLAVYPISWLITSSAIAIAFVIIYRKKIKGLWYSVGLNTIQGAMKKHTKFHSTSVGATNGRPKNPTIT